MARNGKTSTHEERAKLLEEIGYEVSFFEQVDELTVSLNAKRVSIVIVGDEGSEEHCIAAIGILSNLPVIQGARLILSLSENNTNLCRFAAGNGFRDIIPLSLDEPKWLSRFRFSTASKDDLESLLNITQSSHPIDAEIFVPARIVWVNGEQIWVESRARPKLNEKLELIGCLPDDMGCSHIDLNVVSHQNRNLIYRFSEGMICDWVAESDESEKIGQVIDELREHNIGARKRVFLAIQSPRCATRS